jgi:hypothetical protein
MKDTLRTNMRHYQFIASERLSKPMKILKIFHTLTYKQCLLTFILKSEINHEQIQVFFNSFISNQNYSDSIS